LSKKNKEAPTIEEVAKELVDNLLNFKINEITFLEELAFKTAKYSKYHSNNGKRFVEAVIKNIKRHGITIVVPEDGTYE